MRDLEAQLAELTWAMVANNLIKPVVGPGEGHLRLGPLDKKTHLEATRKDNMPNPTPRLKAEVTVKLWCRVNERNHQAEPISKWTFMKP